MSIPPAPLPPRPRRTIAPLIRFLSFRMSALEVPTGPRKYPPRGPSVCPQPRPHIIDRTSRLTTDFERVTTPSDPLVRNSPASRRSAGFSPCRLGRCSKSAAIGSTPVVMPTWSRRQLVTRFGHSLGHSVAWVGATTVCPRTVRGFSSRHHIMGGAPAHKHQSIDKPRPSMVRPVHTLHGLSRWVSHPAAIAKQ